jgi:hypothetical protein
MKEEEPDDLWNAAGRFFLTQARYRGAQTRAQGVPIRNFV